MSFLIFNQVRVETDRKIGFRKILENKSPGKLSGSIYSEIEKNYRIVVFNKSQGAAVGICHYAGFNKLIGFALRIGGIYPLLGSFNKLPGPSSKGKIGLCGSFPPHVPVHCPVSAHQ